MNASGVYIITAPSGRFYIGSAVNMRKRWAIHKLQLRRGAHHSEPLQRAWNKYAGALAFSPLLICDECDLLFYEQRALDVYSPEYNVARTAQASMTGRVQSERARYGRSRSVVCVENGLVFRSSKDAAEWCIAQGLTSSAEARININRAVRLPSATVFGFHWATYQE